MEIYNAYDRLCLRVTFAVVKKFCHEAKARDVGVCRTFRDTWTGELNRPCYGEHFYWHGQAENAWSAKQQVWSAWLKKQGFE